MIDLVDVLDGDRGKNYPTSDDFDISGHTLFLKWYAEPDDVMYAAMHYRNDEIPNEGVIKATIDYTCYKANAEKAVPKFKYYKMCMDELKEVLDTEIKPLINPL